MPRKWRRAHVRDFEGIVKGGGNEELRLRLGNRIHCVGFCQQNKRGKMWEALEKARVRKPRIIKKKATMDDSHIKIGVSWKFLRILGSGGFGQVSLWYDAFSGQKIALKKLLDNALSDESLKSKTVERWCNEVEIMGKLDHANIVSTLEIPEELKMTESLPMLAMEYCCLGDLRQVLNKAENCCGLREVEVINILRDISNGLAYLHSCKIIHRDIKPDNIVLQQKGESTVYKLIDLGYAKALDQNSLSTSFVGTIQYVAPELFMGKEYTSSVDYWSFGLTAHEIITGFRPFLHGFRPCDWMKQIQNKPRSVICVVEVANGEVAFNSEISNRNHLTRVFLSEMEKWLQLALDWDGRTRGRDGENNRLVIFERLTEIICKKLIKVFSLATFDMLSYEVTSETDVSDLRRLLKNDTGVEEDDQLLLLSNGKSLSKNGNLFKSIDIETLDRSRASLYLYNLDSFSWNCHAAASSQHVVELKKLSNTHLSCRQLKKFIADSVFVLQYQALCYRNFLQAIKIKISNTKRNILTTESFYEDLEDEWSKVENYAGFLAFSHKTDLESYIYYRRAGKLKTSPLVQKWIENVINTNSKISELKNSFNKAKQRQLVLVAKKQCKSLEDRSGCDMVRLTPLDCLVEKAQQLWENFRNWSKCDGEIPVTSADAVRLIDKSTEEINKFLKGPALKALFTKISEVDGNLINFHSHLRHIYKSMKILKLMIQHVQTERQKEVWSIIENSKFLSSQVDGREANVEGEASETFEFSSKDNNSQTSAKQDLQIPNSCAPEVHADVMCLTSMYSARSIMDDNRHLRYRIQEVQQTCNEIFNKMTSLNWDFILDP